MSARISHRLPHAGYRNTLTTGTDLQTYTPPRDRTSELRVLGFPNRHLGPVQMTTDTALGVTKIVVQDKSMFMHSRTLKIGSDKLSVAAPLSQIPFIVRSRKLCTASVRF